MYELELEKICKKNSISEMYIYGSYIRGELKEDSDIDIAISGSYTIDQRVLLSSTLSTVFHRNIDLILFDNIDTVFKTEIINTGKLVYTEDSNKSDSMEFKILANYLTLEEDRKVVIDAIFERGSVYG